MTRSTGAALVAACLATSLAQAASPLPVQITRARYVSLGYDTGDRFMSEVEAIRYPDRILPADQVALQNLREQLEAWEYFVVTDGNQQGELFFAVRTGRKLLVDGGTRISGGRGVGEPLGPSMRAEVSSADDLLSIYDVTAGRGPGALLWRARQATGNPFPGKLLAQLKQQVESAPKNNKK